MNIALTPKQKWAFKYYIDLLSATINNRIPPEPYENINWDFFVRHSQRNAVANILGYSVKALKNKPSQEIIKILENERRYSILKETSQLFEVEKVLQEFEKAKIKNVPLKGYFMKHFYLQTDFRTMTDLDILVDKKDFPKVKKIFEKLGYKDENVLNVKEIHFSKDMLYFEIQSNLNEDEETYYNDIWSRVQLRDDYNYSYSMSPEDFYVYMVYHCAKHFTSGGIGIRMLMDISVFLQANKNLNFDYINEAFEKLQLTDFEKRLRSLSISWFTDKETEIDNLGEFILYCSTYGVKEIYFYQDNARDNKHYMLKQIFMPYKSMKARYSYLEKAPVLLPFSWVQYWFTRIFIHHNVNYKSGVSLRVNRLDDENSRFVGTLMDELKIK